MNRPSVLGIVSYKVFPAQMGGQKCVDGFYRQLSEHLPVTLAVARGNEAVPVGQSKILPFLYHHRLGFANLLCLFRLHKLIRQERIDVLIVEHSYLGWMGMVLRWLTNKPFVIRSHNIEGLRFRDMRKAFWRTYLWYEKKVHREADHSFFITSEDMDWAIANWQLPPQQCSVVTYGIFQKTPATTETQQECRQQLLAENGLSPQTKLFLFNGTLDYLPNTDALRIILSELVPRLDASGIPYRIFICGSGVTEPWKKALLTSPSLIFMDFVQDIRFYYQGTDCFINPVTLGAGIKIKLVDALANNQYCISTRSGAKGIPAGLAGGKLLLAEDYDWQAFANAMLHIADTHTESVPETFYQFFQWENIVQQARLSLQTV